MFLGTGTMMVCLKHVGITDYIHVKCDMTFVYFMNVLYICLVLESNGGEGIFHIYVGMVESNGVSLFLRAQYTPLLSLHSNGKYTLLK